MFSSFFDQNIDFFRLVSTGTSTRFDFCSTGKYNVFDLFDWEIDFLLLFSTRKSTLFDRKICFVRPLRPDNLLFSTSFAINQNWIVLILSYGAERNLNGIWSYTYKKGLDAYHGILVFLNFITSVIQWLQRHERRIALKYAYKYKTNTTAHNHRILFFTIWALKLLS